MKRVCIITPFYQESVDVLKRCLQSVSNQTVKCDHLLVGNGRHLTDTLRSSSVRVLQLDRSHSDFGDTPRGVGALLAVAEGYDAISFLDADNWYDQNHVETCLKAAVNPTEFT